MLRLESYSVHWLRADGMMTCIPIVIENQSLTDSLEEGKLESYGVLIREQTIRMITGNSNVIKK